MTDFGLRHLNQLPRLVGVNREVTTHRHKRDINSPNRFDIIFARQNTQVAAVGNPQASVSMVKTMLSPPPGTMRSLVADDAQVANLVLARLVNHFRVALHGLDVVVVKVTVRDENEVCLDIDGLVAHPFGREWVNDDSEASSKEFQHKTRVTEPLQQHSALHRPTPPCFDCPLTLLW
jgi:hypothetical protein